MGEVGSTQSERTREVLDPSFLDQLDQLGVDEVRRRRDRALAEREYQSYLRRLVQVRMDILTREQERRRAGGEAEDLVDRITSVLAGGPRGRGRGEALRLKPSESDMAEAERRANNAMGDAFAKALDSLDDAELARSLVRLHQAEEEISSQRAQVLRVHDALQAELRRRYREDLSQVPVDI